MAVWNLMPNEKYFIENHKYQPHYFSRRKVQGPQESKYSFGQKFTSTHHGHDCRGNLELLVHCASVIHILSKVYLLK